MSDKRAIVVLALVAAWLGVTGLVRADGGVVVVGGGAAEVDRKAVAAAVETVAREAGWALAAKPPGKKESDGLLKCSDATSPWTCVPASFGASGIHQVFVMAVENGQGENHTPMLVITGTVIVTNPQAAVVRQRYCEQCTDDKLSAASTDLAKQLLRELSLRTGHTVVVIKSTPTSAQIVFDGERIGATDGTFNTFPGKHVVIVEKPGYVSETRELTLDEGKTADVAVTLRASKAADTPSSPGEPQRSRLVPALVIGGGVLALAAGTYVSWTAKDAAEGAQHEYRYSGPGIGLAAAGAAAIGVGVFLLLRHPAARSAPDISLAPGGAIASWTIAF